MLVIDTLLNWLLTASFVVAPLGAVAFLVVAIGLWRNRERRDA